MRIAVSGVVFAGALFIAATARADTSVENFFANCVSDAPPEQIVITCGRSVNDPNLPNQYRVQALKLHAMSLVAQARKKASSDPKPYAQAVKEYRESLKIDPRTIFVYINIADVEARELKNFDNAIDILDKGLERYPGNAELLAARGDLWRDKKEYKKAVEDYTAALEVNVYNGTLYMKRSSAYKALGDLGRADADAEKANIKPPTAP